MGMNSNLERLKVEVAFLSREETRERDEISALAGARAEGEAKGEARGRQEAICK